MSKDAVDRRLFLRGVGVAGASMVGGLVAGAELTRGTLSQPGQRPPSSLVESVNFHEFEDLSHPSSLGRPDGAGFTVVCRFQAHHGWLPSIGVLADTALNDTADYALGTQALKVATVKADGAEGSVDSPTYDFAVNLNKKTLRVLFKVDGLADLASLRLYAGDDTLANCRMYNLNFNEIRMAASYVKDSTWTWVTLNGASGGVEGDGAGSVTKWRLTAASVPGKSVTVHLNSIEYATPPRLFPHGVASVCFDDGRLSALLQGKPPLDDFGWAASEYPIVDLIPEARDGRHMTVADLRQCREIAGWEIGLHSQTLRDHDAGFDRLSPDEIKRNLRADRAWVRQNNLGDGDGFAWPLGAFSSASQDAVSSMCAYARLNTTTSLETWPPENVMKIRSAANTDSVAKMKSMVDETSASASWLCLTFHDITPDGAGAEACSTAAYKAVLNYIARRKLSVLPVIDVLRKGGSR